MRFSRLAAVLTGIACLQFASALAESARPYRFVNAVAEARSDGFVDVFVRTTRALPRETDAEDEEVGRAVLGSFVLARRRAKVVSAVTPVGFARRHCYAQTLEYERLPAELTRIGARVRLSFRFESRRRSIVGTALVIRPAPDASRRLGCRT